MSPARDVLPRPHDPLFALAALAPIDAQTIEQRMRELEFSPEERDILAAELEGL